MTTRARRFLNERRSPGETVDPIPMEAPAGHGKPATLREMIQSMVRNQLGEVAKAQDAGSFEDEDDFEDDFDSELDILSGHQIILMDPEDLGIVETLDGVESEGQEAPESDAAGEAILRPDEAIASPRPPLSSPAEPPADRSTE